MRWCPSRLFPIEAPCDEELYRELRENRIVVTTSLKRGKRNCLLELCLLARRAGRRSLWENVEAMNSFVPIASARLTVAVVGGGFTGAAMAMHLVAGKGFPTDASVVVIEPRSELGRGLAYSATDPAHRVNVPAARMTLFPDMPDDFENYLSDMSSHDDTELVGHDGSPYPKRSVFGDYVSARIQPFLDDGRIRHWWAKAISVSQRGSCYEIAGSDGTEPHCRYCRTGRQPSTAFSASGARAFQRRSKTDRGCHCDRCNQRYRAWRSSSYRWKWPDICRCGCLSQEAWPCRSDNVYLSERVAVSRPWTSGAGTFRRFPVGAVQLRKQAAS